MNQGSTQDVVILLGLIAFAPARILTWYPGKMVFNALISNLLPPPNLRGRRIIVNGIYGIMKI